MIYEFNGITPDISAGAYVHANAVVIGDVRIGKDANLWPGAVVRGDMARITIGKRTNAQDGSVLHTDYNMPMIVGDNVTIGHNAVLHSCDIGSNTLIGMGAVVLNAANVGDNCIVAAGTLIPGGKVIPPRSLVMGNPYRIVRELTDEEIAKTMQNAEDYVALSKMHIRTSVIK